MAFRDGSKLAKPVLLEPVMKVEIMTPENYMGDVVGDVNRRRGIVLGMDDTPTGKTINCEVPLAEMFGYSSNLRSATQGRATYSMQFEKYNEAPLSVTRAVIDKTS
jgi:elongation factor G